MGTLLGRTQIKGTQVKGTQIVEGTQIVKEHR
jgi:hypothetical protein